MHRNLKWCSLPHLLSSTAGDIRRWQTRQHFVQFCLGKQICSEAQHRRDSYHHGGGWTISETVGKVRAHLWVERGAWSTERFSPVCVDCKTDLTGQKRDWEKGLPEILVYVLGGEKNISSQSPIWSFRKCRATCHSSGMFWDVGGGGGCLLMAEGTTTTATFILASQTPEIFFSDWLSTNFVENCFCSMPFVVSFCTWNVPMKEQSNLYRKSSLEEAVWCCSAAGSDFFKLCEGACKCRFVLTMTSPNPLKAALLPANPRIGRNRPQLAGLIRLKRIFVWWSLQKKLRQSAEVPKQLSSRLRKNADRVNQVEPA